MLTHRKLKEEEYVDMEDGESIQRKNIKGFRNAVVLTFIISTAIAILFFIYIHYAFVLTPTDIGQESSSVSSERQIGEYIPDNTKSLTFLTPSPPEESPSPLEETPSSPLEETPSFPEISLTEQQQNWIRLIESDTTNHIVHPPAGNVTLVQCQATCGVFGIAVHVSWARNGANRFLEMVQSEFFSTKVGLFRALKGFLVQFGLSGNPKVQGEWNRKGELRDDPPWLPQGPPGREINGIKRFKRGYIAYAGAGLHTRGTQLIIAFRDDGPLGGAPWEVPFGQLVGEDSYKTLDSIYTGYDEKPSQGKIQNQGVQYLEKEFPLLDYITSCKVIATDIHWSRDQMLD